MTSIQDKHGYSWATRALCLLAFAAAFGMKLERAEAACPNEAFRTGASASLPDCRAYELVTPPDTDGRLLKGPDSLLTFDQFPIELLSPSRASVVYMTYGTPVPDLTEPNGVLDVYQARRFSEGWQTVRRISPSGAQALIPDAGGISSDHRYAFVHVSPLPSSSGGSFADEGSTDYLGNPDGSFELVGIGQLGAEQYAQGRYISEGGEHVIFTTGGNWCNLVVFVNKVCPVLQLEPNAPPTGTPAIYDRGVDGPTRVISLLPGNVPPGSGEAAEYQGSAADGSVVAFKVAGTLYVRVDNEVTKEVTSSTSIFAGLSRHGEKLFYVSEGNIFEFDVSSGASNQINASGDGELVNISSDGSHVYFISPSQLDGTQGVASQPNLYVWTAGDATPRYVATVLPSDLERTSGTTPGYPALTNWTDWVVTPDRTKSEVGVGPGGNSSRTTPDGKVLVFESRAQLLSGYDNKEHTEIYRYSDVDGSLQCVSCSPSSSSATADARFQASRVVRPWIAINNVSADGSRVFFETAESLETRDTNGVNDIYEWQQHDADDLPVPSLISTGRSPEYPSLIPGLGYAPEPNVIMGIDPEGYDVAFIALERLVPAAPGGGSPAIYDARVDGGFPESTPPLPCSPAESCQETPAGSPARLTPESDRLTGAGNVSKHRRRHCRRHQHKKGAHTKKDHYKKRCVRRHKGKKASGR